MTRRASRPRRPYWVAECPVTTDQGAVEAWITARGRSVLACDVCHATWFEPELVPGREVYPDDATGQLDDGDVLYLGGSWPATREELERIGWWDRVPPRSRAWSDAG